MKHRWLIWSLLLIWSVTWLTGCGNGPQSAAPPAGYKVTDDAGQEITLRQKPQRIVSLTLGTDEMLLALVESKRLAALTYLVDDAGISSASEGAKVVPGRVKAELESILTAQPDLVIVANWQSADLIKGVQAAGVPVYVYKTPATVAEVMQVVTKLAALVGEPERGQQLVGKMQQDLDALQQELAKVPPETRLRVIRYTLMGATYGQGSLFDDMCRLAGVENGVSLAGGDAFGILPKERMVSVNPDILILSTWDYEGKTNMEEYRQQLLHDPALQSVKAIAAERLVMLPDREISSASQHIVKGVRALAHAAYPAQVKP